MPHITLEYTPNLEEQAPTTKLFLDFHHILATVAGIEIDNCKSRWWAVDDWVIGEEKAASAFAHLDVRFLEGRTDRVRQAVGVALLERLKEHFSTAPSELDLQITVEIREIHKACYFKHPPGTLSAPPLKQV